MRQLETAAFRHASRRRGGRLAAHGAGAAVARLPPIRFLGTATPSLLSHWTAAFVQRLRDLGWVEERTISLDIVGPRVAMSATLR